MSTFYWYYKQGSSAWTTSRTTWKLGGGNGSGAIGSIVSTDDLYLSSGSANYTVTFSSTLAYKSLSIENPGFTVSGTTYRGVPTLEIDSGSLTVGALNQSAGTINIDGGTLKTTGLYTHTGGTLAFTGNGTLELDGGVSGATTLDFGTAAQKGTLFWNNTSTATLNNLSLANFFTGDALKILTLGTVGAITIGYSGTANAGTVTLSGGISASFKVSNATVGNLSAAHFHASITDGAVTITSDLPCFLRGTRISTLRGDVAVEDLRIGDLLITAVGGAQPVKWIGTRAYITRLVHEHHRTTVMPVRITAGALGEASPVRDLFVSPEHLICIDNVLVPAGKLLNGTTITRCESFEVVQYFHVELPLHSVIYAEGAPAESFLDTGNRNMFSNVLDYLDLGCSLNAPPQGPCLPVVTEGEPLAAARARLTDRAARAGLIAVGEANLHLLVDGVAIRPDSQNPDAARFAVPAGARQINIVSRSVVPADIDPASSDRRHLGVCLHGLSLHDDSFSLDVGPNYAGLQTGFHGGEEGRRWTSGDAVLPPDLFAAMSDGFTLELKLVHTSLRYPAPIEAAVIPFAARVRPDRPVSAPERISA